MTDAAIPAATIILLRDRPAYEVLMIERHADTPFAGGAIVFPGGRIEASDGAPAWRALCDGADHVRDEEFAPRVAAIREAYEETGVLLARRGGALLSDTDAAALGEMRKGVEDDDTTFIELVRRHELRLALDALHLFARWEPPLRGLEHQRRYHTWFFAAQTPDGQRAREDGNEATEVFWGAPADILQSCDDGKRKAIFPTRRNLELLGVSDGAGAALAFAGERRIDVIQPEIVDRDGALYLTIPDDMGYPVTQESVASAMRS